MRTNKLLMAALALPLAFAACTNEELVEISQPQVEINKVTGDKLIAQGAVVTLSDDVESRYDGGFEGTDKLGLAWWNNPKSSNKTIYDPQNETNFKYQSTDGKIYNNLLVQKNEETDEFFVNGDIYSSAYFVYFPYQKLGSVKNLVVDYTDFEQKEAYSISRNSENKYWVNGYMENTLHLTHKMLLTSNDVDDNFNVNIDAIPVAAVNTLIVTTELGSQADYSEDLMALVELDKVTISTGNKTIFYPSATVYPNNLPEKALDENGKFDEVKTGDALKASVYDQTVAADKRVLKLGTRKSTISTKLGYENNIADDQLVALYTFSGTTLADNVVPSIVVETNVGKFTYDSKEEGTSNFEQIEKLANVLQGKVYNANGAVFNIAGYNNTKPSVSLVLDMEDLVLNKEIETAEQWYALMPFYEAAGEDVEVTLGDDITFTEAVPFTLPEGITVTVKESTKNITFEGNQTIGKNFVANVPVVIEEGAVLNVPENVTFVTGNVDNNGTINVAENAVIKGYTTDMKITNETGIINCDGSIVTNISVENTDGIINVTYGKSYIEHDGKGVISGELDGEDTEISKDPVAAIYKMSKENDNSAVKCNVLVVKNIDIKNGDKTSPWSEVSSTIDTNTFKEIKLILEDSSLDAADGILFVAEINATNSPISGKINVSGNLKSVGSTLEGEMNVDENLDVKTATMSGTFTVNGDLNAENSTLVGEYEVSVNASLNKVTVNEATVINVEGDMEIESASNFTCTTLKAEDVVINGNGTTKFTGTTLDAATLTINESTLQLTHHSHKLNGVTTLIHSHIKTTGKIMNENGGRVRNTCADCTITENYAPVDEDLENDKVNMQSLVKVLIDGAKNAGQQITDEVTLAARLNTLVPAGTTLNNSTTSHQFINLMKDYIDVTVGSITANDIKLFENMIGQQIDFGV